MKQHPGKLLQLEGLRGIAAVVVLLSHIRLTFLVHEALGVGRYLGSIFGTMFEAMLDGNFAVWLFWVMSAFVLSIRFHLGEQNENACLQMTDATIRRYPRLMLPVLASVLLAWGLHTSGLMTNTLLAAQLGPNYDKWLATYYLFDPNFIDAIKSALWQSFFNYDATTSYNSVLWTMEIELYGFFFLFAYLSLVGKHPVRWLVYLTTTIIIYSLSLHWLNAFVWGTILCDVYIHRNTVKQSIPKSILNAIYYLNAHWVFSLVLIAPIIYLIGLPNHADILHLFLATILTGYVVISPSLKKFLCHPLPVFLGKISFGLYLAHFPIICALAYPTYNTFLAIVPQPVAAICSSLMLIIISLGAGWGMWYLADRPAIAFSRYIAKFLNGNIVKPPLISDSNWQQKPANIKL